ncbi:hypothetical protein GNI_049740 [Gregarina niphandrodes]|uniref:Uncharacterized protein n=1 Tax=Gregarina niphandrodes TaxID=110365 RepID=A0A023B9J9_GRENI|nr:hypothetical protein GNI_049740 [Gregarina niphandrodes]EZG72997.1 hypothetical protein GNI_049740 [Gregarina niphandrodes]|eukprot:XP_011129692.1 hypothetical protein GNI_049740 [Gregarina niphandrodes]
MRKLSVLSICAFATSDVQTEALNKVILAFANSQTAWNDKFLDITNQIRTLNNKGEDASTSHTVPWLFEGGHFNPVPHVPDIHSVHPDEEKKSIFGFSWGKHDAKNRHSPSNQYADHRIPGSRVTGLQANLVGDGLNMVFGRKTNSWFDLLNIGGGKLDKILTNADTAKKAIEKLINEAGVGKDVKKKLMGALENYETAILEDMFTGFLAREYLAPSLGSGLWTVIRNVAANKELPLDQAIHSLNHRLGGLASIEDMFEKLPNSKSKKEIGTALKKLKDDLSRSISDFTKELQQANSLSVSRRRLQAIDDEDVGGESGGQNLDRDDADLEKELQGVFDDILSTATQAKNALGGSSPAGGSSTSSLSSMGSKLINQTVENSIISQISSATGIQKETLKSALKKAKSTGNTAADKLKKLIDGIKQTLGASTSAGEGNGDVKTQLSGLTSVLKKKLGSAQDLLKMLKDEYSTDAEGDDKLSKDDTKKLLDAIEVLSGSHLAEQQATEEEELGDVLATAADTEETEEGKAEDAEQTESDEQTEVDELISSALTDAVEEFSTEQPQLDDAITQAGQSVQNGVNAVVSTNKNLTGLDEEPDEEDLTADEEAPLAEESSEPAEEEETEDTSDPAEEEETEETEEIETETAVDETKDLQGMDEAVTGSETVVEVVPVTEDTTEMTDVSEVASEAVSEAMTGAEEAAERVRDEVEDAGDSMAEEAAKAKDGAMDAADRLVQFKFLQGAAPETASTPTVDAAPETASTPTVDAAPKADAARKADSTDQQGSAAMVVVPTAAPADATEVVLVPTENASEAAREEANSEELEEVKSTISADVDEALTQAKELGEGVAGVAGNVLGSAGEAVREVGSSLFSGN